MTIQFNSSAAYHVKETKRVSTGKRIGYRIQVAVPNKARYDPSSEEMVQSFAPCYLIKESGDYTKMTDDILNEFLRGIMAWHKISNMYEA